MGARETALRVLMSCRNNHAWADAALKAQLGRDGLVGPEAALCSRLVYGVVQNQQLLDFYLSAYCSQKPDHLQPPLLEILRLGAYQILYLDRVPDSAAVGVAAHEAGHAVQYAENYGPVRLRTAIIPATQIGSKFSFILLLVGMVLYSQSLFLVGILLFSLTTIFQLITLPVEFNASHRALQTLENEQLLYDDELPGARKVLKAAALTYVAALLMSALQLLRYVLIFVGRNNRGRRDN